MSFDFDFFQDHPQGPNLEQVMHQIEQKSFQFDQFDPVEQNPHIQKSFNSDFFGNELKPEEKVVSAKSQGKNQSFDFDNSRNISEISYLNNQKNRSFRYQKPPESTSNNHKSNARYERLQQMLGQAKKNNLDNFYKNLDQQNAYKPEEKFRNKEEFLYYRNQFKVYKRDMEQQFLERNGQYNFKNNHYKQPLTNLKPSVENTKTKDPSGDGFKKKQSNPFATTQSLKPPNKISDAPKSNYLLPSEFVQDENFDFFQVGEEQINKEVNKYKEKQYLKEAKQFFGAEEQNKREKKSKQTVKLEAIREERPNIFQLTHEQQKMTNLIGNYEEMKKNFNDLMCNLKETNTDQEKIINEIKFLKHQYENKQSRLKIQAQTKKQKRELRERQRQEKEKMLHQMKEKMGKMSNGNQKDVLYLKINQKIQFLQQMVKNAMIGLNKQREQKFVPKIINYYRQEEANAVQKSQNSMIGFSRQEAGQNEDSQIGKLEQQKLLAPVRNALRQLKEERREQQPLYNLDQFSSPLQLDLTTQQYPMNQSRNRSQQLQQPFVPPQGAKLYSPNGLDTSNKYLRRCLTQKSSIVFQSFEFYVTGKFTMSGNDRYPVLCQVRVANKCAVSLFDVFVVVFGPQAQESQLQMRPPKMMHEEFKHSTSFLFEVDLSKSCLESGGFSVMIAYKTDSVNKKKVVFKVILPFVQLIRPQFIYQEQFTSGWNHMGNEIYVNPKTLDFNNLRNNQDLKLLLPLIQINESDPNAFSYGIMFRYPTTQTVFMLKITCYVSGKASLHLKSSENGTNDRKLKEEILDKMSYLCFG